LPGHIVELLNAASLAGFLPNSSMTLAR